MKAKELAEILMAYPNKNVKIHFNFKDNKTDELGSYISDEIQVLLGKKNNVLICTALLINKDNNIPKEEES